MVQFCPKCGTAARDDKSVFCNRCGSRIPPPVPEKTEIRCPSCGTINADPQAVFCNKCGAGLHTVPPVLARPAGARPAAAPPVKTPEPCPSCGAPRVDEKSDFCNVCGADFRLPAPPATAGVLPQPEPERTGAGPFNTPCEPAKSGPETTPGSTPLAAIRDDGSNGPEQVKNRIPLRKWGLMAGAAVIVLVVIALFFSGMLPGTGPSSDATPAAAQGNLDSGVLPTTLITIPAATLAPTPAATPVPTTALPTKTTAAVTTKVSATATSKASANTTANASAKVTAAMTLSSASQPLFVGQRAYDGKGILTVNDFSLKDKMSDPVPSYAVGKKYLIINITYENLDRNATVDADSSMMKVMDGGGYPSDPASDSLLATPWNGKSILPQEKRTGNLLFIVSPTATFLKLQYTAATKNSALFQLT